MKVIAINGSPRKGGNVSQCLDVMAAEFAKEGIEFEVLQPGPRVHPCMACYHCLNNGDIHCVQKDDMVNEIIDKCIEADGIILTSPVYHGGIAGGMNPCWTGSSWRPAAAVKTSSTTKWAPLSAPSAVPAAWPPISSCWVI